MAQGVVTGIRGLCNGLGPALFGFIFYLFHVDLNETTDVSGSHKSTSHANQTVFMSAKDVSVCLKCITIQPSLLPVFF